MTLEQILEMQAKHEKQKLDRKISEVKIKTKEDTVVFCVSLIAQQVALNTFAIGRAK